mgnify:CR=1 FL=1
MPGLRVLSFASCLTQKTIRSPEHQHRITNENTLVFKGGAGQECPVYVFCPSRLVGLVCRVRTI